MTSFTGTQKKTPHPVSDEGSSSAISGVVAIS